ncbi:ATP-binding protein [Helicovermis profundi]|uniref:Stage 0 sporulation protein A homolog n=1 Tax=Helicovermis profundi TaxID=3065157 RepID=A0AAU9ELE2_9FIRM|nr:hypothetical protein HLPR_27540 [Clostridia bacterium S502]
MKYDKKSREELIQIIDNLKTMQISNKEKSRFVTNISHEVRTPLNGMLGMVQLLKETELDSIQTEYVDILFDSSIKLTETINSILEISKLEEKKYKEEKKIFSIKDLINEIVNTYSNEINDKKLLVVFEIDDSLPQHFIGDLYSLRKVLVNIIDNAVKFTDKGKIEIKIGRIKYTKKRISVSIVIKDTGIGIPSDKYQYVFGRFNKLETKGIKNKGVGLGLSIAREFINIMNGKIELDSKLGIGTEVKIELKLEHLKNEITSKSTSKPEILNLNNRKKILVAEDELVGRITLKFMLREYYDLIFAKNGEECIENYIKEKPDLILMDIMMPIKNGFETLDEINHMKNKRKIPIIACTAKVMDTERNYLISYGFSDYISKPIDMKKLLLLIDKHLKAEN